MSQRLLVGTRKGLFRIERADAEWQITRHWFAGDPVSMVLHDPHSGRIHAALDLGHFGVKVKRSDDDGQTWSEASTPAYPSKPDDREDKDPVRGTDIPWSTKLIWSLEAGVPGELWCGVIPGGLFRSSDGGNNWTLVRSLWEDPLRSKWTGGGYDFAGIHSICVDPRDSQHLILGVSVGGVWRSRDAGETWQLIGSGLRAAYMPCEAQHEPIAQDPHRIVQCKAQPDRLWMQHHNGIFRSDDAGESWHEIKEVAPSSFGFAVAVHPEDPDTAWFVPAVKDEQRIPVDGKLVVTRTRDGGRSFDVLDEGLPAAHAYDLVYRHALAVCPEGKRLAFGSTTGSLWISEDQGDHWQAVSHHLPPISCVHFTE